jgi:hypothetical protein
MSRQFLLRRGKSEWLGARTRLISAIFDRWSLGGKFPVFLNWTAIPTGKVHFVPIKASHWGTGIGEANRPAEIHAKFIPPSAITGVIVENKISLEFSPP